MKVWFIPEENGTYSAIIESQNETQDVKKCDSAVEAYITGLLLRGVEQVEVEPDELSRILFDIAQNAA